MNSIDNNYIRRLLLITCSLMLNACQSGLPVKTVITGTVTKVHDGDSIHVTPTGKKRVVVRLAAIDAPEIKQEHGMQSRDYLRSMVMNREVTVRCNKVDKYRREICVVLLEDRDINLAMLTAGQAWYYSKYKNEQPVSHRRSYKKAESQARKKEIGLWQSEPVPPWTFRALAKS